MEDSASAGGETNGSERTTIGAPGSAGSWQPPRSRADRSAEDAALSWVRRGRLDEALKIMMTAYGTALTAFILRVVRDRELAKDLRQQVFLEAYQGIERFEGRGTLWSWLCGIAYHRCLDELRRLRRANEADDVDVWNGLFGEPGSTVDEDRVAKRRALEHCLGRLSAAMRSQLLMRCFLGLTYVEIGLAVGAPQGTVQVRLARILPRVRRCLHGEGVGR